MNVSFAGIDPPFAKFGETKTTRPTTSDAIRVRLPIRTDPVSSTVSACATGAGRTTLTAGLAFSSVRSDATLSLHALRRPSEPERDRDRRDNEDKLDEAEPARAAPPRTPDPLTCCDISIPCFSR